MKTIILIRHSIPNKTNIENHLYPLSEEGIEKAKKFFKLPIFKNINKVYSSTYLRAYQTASIFSKDVFLDERLIERLIGDSKTAHKSQWKKQYDDHDFKNMNGESLNEVKQRMSQCIHEILEKMNDNETILVVSHATSICSYLLNFCDIQVTDEMNKIRKIIFKDKIILEDRIDTPSCFVVKYNNHEVVDITYVDIKKVQVE